MAAHGHVHAAETPAHGHPVVGSVAAPIPGRLSPLSPAKHWNNPASVFTTAWSRRQAAPAGPNHDPPSRGATVSVLRI